MRYRSTATSLSSLVGIALVLAGAFSSPVAAGDAKVEASHPVVVAIYGRTETGVFVSRGSGFVARSGLVVTARDERRYHTRIFVRLEGTEYLIEATPVASKHPTNLDLYEVRMPAPSPPPTWPGARGVRVGARVVAHALAISGAARFEGTVRGRHDGVIEVSFASSPSPDQVGGPVLADDGSVVGVLTGVQTEGGDFLVVPSASIVARLGGKPESGSPLTDTGPAAKKLPPPPPKPLNLPDPLRSGDPPQEAGRAGNYGSGSGAGTGNGAAGGNSGTSNRSPVAPLPPDPRIVTKAKVLNSPRPAYTEQARDNGTQGNVILRVTLGANGRVKSASVVRGLPDGLNEKAIEAVYRLEFEPARDLAGQSVDSVLTVSVNFLISFRDRDMTGVWIAADRDETPSVQFYFSVVAPATRVGLVIIEVRSGVYACVPVTSSFNDGVFAATATVPSASCSYRWTGRTGSPGFAVEEVRSCRTDGESRRGYTLTRIRKQATGVAPHDGGPASVRAAAGPRVPHPNCRPPGSLGRGRVTPSMNRSEDHARIEESQPAAVDVTLNMSNSCCSRRTPARLQSGVLGGRRADWRNVLFHRSMSC